MLVAMRDEDLKFWDKQHQISYGDLTFTNCTY